MDTGAILHTASFSTGPGEGLSAQLIENLEQFVRHHYRVNNVTEFNDTILGVNKPGDLTIFYDHYHRIIGFMRLYRQTVQVDAKEYMVFLGGTYHDPRLNICYNAAKIGLIQAMKYQLGHPEQALAFFSSVNTPLKYHFLATMSEVVYPHPQRHMPASVLQLVEALKAQNHWQSTAEHPMIIKNQLAVLHPNLQSIEPNALTDFYLSLNPNYAAGHALLVYLPLNLATIGHGIKHVVTHSSYFVTTDRNSPRRPERSEGSPLHGTV